MNYTVNVKIIVIYAILDYHLTVRIYIIVSCNQSGAFKLRFCKVKTLISCNLVAVVYVVEISFVFNYFICFLNYTVNVKIIVNYTILFRKNQMASIVK